MAAVYGGFPSDNTWWHIYHWKDPIEYNNFVHCVKVIRERPEALEVTKVGFFFRGFFHFEGVLIVNWPSEIDLSRSRIDRINSLWDMIILKISFVIVWYGADSSSTTALRPTNSNCEYRGLDDSTMMHHYPAVTLLRPRGCRVFCNTYKIIIWWNYNQFDLTLRLTSGRN